MKKYKIEHVIDKNEHIRHKYRLNSDKFNERYGFQLSKLEIDEIYLHIQALEDFMGIPDKYALIYTTLQSPEVISDFDLSEDDWNFILLQQETPYKYMPQQGYSLGYKWSDMNYLVSKEGCKIILDRIKQIDKPYCDVILELIGGRKLTSFVFKDDNFNLKIQEKRYDESRNNEILSAIFNKNRWTQHDRRKVRELLKIAFSEAANLGVDLFINEGTLLGCIRHGEIMKWDDDLDIAINNDEVERFLNQLRLNKNIEMGTAYLYGKHLFYKIWLRDCKEIPGHRHRFPFIDIWPFYIVDSEVRYDFGYQYPIEDIFPLTDCYFEETSVKIPKDSVAYLNNRYPGWKQKIVFYPYSHQEERTKEKLLEAYITVDSTGFMM
ncbi:LicD family protein [Sphingobacterium thalpophilum]|uniref:LicD family protein n=1 Tax=Sphingobacterium thalpophilum TaxID=259 RepID=UPI0037DA1A1B